MTLKPKTPLQHHRRVDDTENLRPLSERVIATTTLPLPTSAHELTWRALRPEDFPALLEFECAVDAVDDPGSHTGLDDLQERWESSGFDPGVDSMIALTPEGRVVAYGEAFLEASGETMATVHLNGRVHPAWRRQGIGTALLRWQEGRGVQQLASCDDRLPGMLSTLVGEHADGQRALFEAEGFSPVRWWHEMEFLLGGTLPQTSLGAGLKIEPYTSSCSEQARETINEAFRDHWGSQPTSREEWDDARASEDFRADWSAVAIATLADGTTDLVGAITVESDEDEWEAHGYSFGNVDELAVKREWRGRGIARALLAQSLRAMRDSGVERATLDVDGDSPTGADALYARLGFVETERSATYAKTY